MRFERLVQRDMADAVGEIGKQRVADLGNHVEHRSARVAGLCLTWRQRGARPTSSHSDEADVETAAQLDALIGRQHPEVFDSRRRLRCRAPTRALTNRFGGTCLLSDQLDDVNAAGRGQRDVLSNDD